MIFISQCVQYQRLIYGSSYSYPLWADVIGILISLSSMIWIPVYAIYYVLSGSGTVLENFLHGIKPQIKERKLSLVVKKVCVISESNVGLLTKSTSFVAPKA